MHCMSFKNDIIFNINIDNIILSQITSTKFLEIIYIYILVYIVNVI